MNERRRGLYRGIYSALLDHPDYQTLSSPARLTLLTLRLCTQNTVASIFRYYASVLQTQTGLPLPTLETTLAELAAEGWIEREGVVVWIRNGLRYDPNIRLADPKHEIAVSRAIAALPRCDLVIKFCDYYKIARPFQGPSKGLAGPLDDPSPPSTTPSPTPSPTPSSERRPPVVTREVDSSRARVATLRPDVLSNDRTGGPERIDAILDRQGGRPF